MSGLLIHFLVKEKRQLETAEQEAPSQPKKTSYGTALKP
jgi:hypothetical protein